MSWVNPASGAQPRSARAVARAPEPELLVVQELSSREMEVLRYLAEMQSTAEMFSPGKNGCEEAVQHAMLWGNTEEKATHQREYGQEHERHAALVQLAVEFGQALLQLLQFRAVLFFID